MAIFNDCILSGQTVILDGNEYNGCKFINSKIIVTRGNYSLKNCRFSGCNFEFGGEAANIKKLVMDLLNQRTTKGG